MEKWVGKEVFRLVDSYANQDDINRFLKKLENYFDTMVQSTANEKLKEMGVEVLNVHGVNYHGQTWEDEMIYGVGYLERFDNGSYALRLKEDWNDKEWFINVLVYRGKITGKGSRRYRYFILELLNKYKQPS